MIIILIGSLEMIGFAVAPVPATAPLRELLKLQPSPASTVVKLDTSSINLFVAA